jgi:hypothetical protein
MHRPSNKTWRLERWLLALVGSMSLFASPAFADPPKAATKVAEPVALPSGTISDEDWRKASTMPLAKGEIDRLISRELSKIGVKPAPRTTDEQFLRRVTVDLVGRLPTPAELDAFVKEKRPDKRAKVVDRLLASDDYARHWARYWREVFASRLTDNLVRVFANHFERWLTEQLKADKSWAEITRDMLTASGEMKFAETDKNGPAFFLLSRRGADAAVERAAEASRVFLGIQIQCAQCHDHPFDVWKRDQFHQLAAYFGKLRDRPIFENKRIVGASLVSPPFGDYRLPDKDDPKKSTAVTPRFLDGQKPAGFRLTDQDRRKSLADAITSRDNPWFAAAFVNRMWGELMGQAFVRPIDDLGPQKEVMMPPVLTRVAGAFRGSDYNIKDLLRAITTSEAYQRQIRPGESKDEHLLFAASSPARMSADTLWQALVGTLGPIGGGAPGFMPKKGPGPFAGRFGLEFLFKQEFAFDPSTPPNEVEGSIPQALLLMNNPAIGQRIQAKGATVLAKILTENPKDDDDAIRAVYRRTLGRGPSERELSRCRQHLSSVANRPEAFEDILWALINSTEFQTER